ncbi:MAG: S-layer homology domain-containing protein [Thermaerobacter sp.]|nr:S-layer homology domain-containing protein [Thermaerobacter sp.]
MRKFTPLLAALLLPLWPMAAASAASVTFPDVPASYWAAPAIDALAAQGIISGERDGLYHPLAPVTRAQFAALIVRAEHLSPAAVGPHFQDVLAGSTLSSEVETAAANGLMLGTSLTQFSPSATINRAMAAAIAVRALGLGTVGTDSQGRPSGFHDASDIPGYAVGDVYVAREIGIMQGLSSGNFDPSGLLNRAQAAEVIYRLVNLSPATIANVAAQDVASISAGMDSSAIAVGGSTGLWSVARDSLGNNIPANVVWKANGGTVNNSSFSSSTPGQFTVTATVAGSSVTHAVQVTVQQPTNLAIYALPEVAGVNAHVGFTVTILDQTGARDTSASPTAITLFATSAGASPVTLTATAHSGQANFTFTPPTAGAWHLQATAPGLLPANAAFDVLAQPFGALQLTANSTVLPGQTQTVAVALPQGASESSPVVLTSSDPSVVSVDGSGQGSLTASGLTFKLLAAGTGSATLTLANPLNAYAQTTWNVVVPTLGTLAIAPPPVAAAGEAVTESVQVNGNGVPAPAADVSLTLTNPQGIAVSTVDATASGTTASFNLKEDEAGTWSLKASAPGYTSATTSWTVQPGAPTQLIATGAPSTIVVLGRTATLQVMAADAYDNPVPEPLTVTLQASGNAGAFSQTTASLSGPGPAATFTPSALGTESVLVTATSSPSLAPVKVTFRVIQSAADVVQGKGVWLLESDWAKANQPQLIAQLQQLGITHVYLEVEGSWGFYGSSALRHFLYRAHDAGIAVLAWVYPYLQNVSLDENLTTQVANYVAPTGDKPDGIAADIEENMSAGAVGPYAQAVRQALGPQGVLIAVTYPPIYHESYPFAALAPYVTAYAPMDYWHYQAVGEDFLTAYNYVHETVGLIHQLSGNPNIPVTVIGQTYDMFSSGGQGVFSPTEFEEEAAFQAASDAGAIGLSFYRLPTMTPEETQAIETLPYPYPSR